MKIEDIRVGQRVRWNDPDEGKCSGNGTVIGLRCDGIVNLLKDDGGEVEVLTHEIELVESEKQLFTVSMRVDGRVDVTVEATSFKEAFELAQSEQWDPTEVQCVEFVPVNATDSSGEMRDYN